MKLFIKSFIVAVCISIIFTMVPFSAECESISNNVFRLHILANSDSEADQSLKLKVRDKVLEYTQQIYGEADSLIEAENITAVELQNIANIAQNAVYENGYNYPVKVQICNMYFDTRYYDDITMPAGNYDALRITIGSGQGHNWWCVMYPSVCIGASSDYNSLKEKTTDDEYKLLTESKVVYKFKIVEYFEKICSYFY